MNPTLIILITLLILGILLWSYRNRSKVNFPDAEKRHFKAEHKKEIMTLFSVTGARITNDDVQRLVNVSDATATRYLEELEQEKLITQVGREGKYVYYEKR
jgi:Fic family protein